jgi:hypothetical protein
MADGRVDDVGGAASEPGPSTLARRRWLGMLLGAPVAYAGLRVLDEDPAGAAAAAWVVSGNAVPTNGSQFLGTTNVAPLVFKTKASSGAGVTEKARLTPAGLLGVGLTNPTSTVHAKTTGKTAITGDTSNVGGFGVSGNVTARTAGAGAVGVRGVSQGAGTGVAGIAGRSGDGVKGTSIGGGNGVAGESPNGYGVLGHGLNGVYGEGQYNGLIGIARLASSTGVYAQGGTGSSGSFGVDARAGYRGVTSTGGNAGVFGSSGYVGVWGTSSGTDGGWGLFGDATGTTGVNYGVYGRTYSPSGYAGYFQGRTHVSGTLTKSAGSFRIDHPLDPENKYLSHSFVESPDMMNVYNGNVVLGAGGTAVVELPAWFEALNHEFRYQLTPIGAPAQLYVKREIAGNRFEIAGGRAGLKVSWQVTGIRQDDYAKAHPIVVEERKPAAERGRGAARAGGGGAPAAPSPDGVVATPG